MLFLSSILAFLTILIEDVNDNSPLFKERFYKRSIAENSSPGVSIVHVAAIDKVSLELIYFRANVINMNIISRIKTEQSSTL